jgi:hypothetical protein
MKLNIFSRRLFPSFVPFSRTPEFGHRNGGRHRIRNIQEFSTVASGLFGFGVFIQILGVQAVDILTARARSLIPHESTP